jgi:ankyrin repeat protein
LKLSGKVSLFLLAGLIVACVFGVVAPSCGLFSPSTPPTVDYTAVDEAALGNDVKTVEFWINKDPRVVERRDVNGDTALHKAAFHGSLGVVDLLLKHHAAIDAQNRQGMTPLILASRAGQVEVVKRLLHAKANVNIRDADGWTALRWALSKNRDEIAQLLRAAHESE